MRAIVVSSLGLLFTSTLELVVVVFSGSVALLADGLHNLGDVFTTVGVYFGFRTRTATAAPRTSPASSLWRPSGAVPSSPQSSRTTSCGRVGAPLI